MSRSQRRPATAAGRGTGYRLVAGQHAPAASMIPRSRRRASSALAVWCWLGAILAGTPAAARDGDSAGITPFTRFFTGLPHRVAYADPYLYVGLDSGLATFDVSSLADPRLIGHVYLPSPAFDIAIRGSHVYVANGESGLTVVDIADPFLPLVVGTYRPPTSDSDARGIDVVGTVAYLAESAAPGSIEYGLRTIDVTDPTLPSELGYLPLDNGALCVTVDGTTALVGLGSELGGRNGLVAIDVGSAVVPVEIAGSFIDLGIAVRRIAVSGAVTLLAVGDRSIGYLVTADTTVPGSPAVFDQQFLVNGALDLSLRPGLAFVALSESGLAVMDVSDPTRIGTPRVLPLDQAATTVFARGDTAFVGLRSSNGEGAIASVTTPAVGTMRRLGDYGFAEATAAAATPGVAYLLRRDTLHIYDTTIPTSPVWLSSWGITGGDFSAIDVEYPLAAIAEGRDVLLIDVTDPRSPSSVGAVTVETGVALGVVLQAPTLYVATGTGLEAYDVSSPSAPTQLGGFTTAGVASAFAVDGDWGYLVAGEELLVVDVATPSAMAVVGSMIVVGEQLRGVAASGDLVVMTGAQSYLHTVDVGVRTSPTLDATLPGFAGVDVRLFGDRAIVAAGRDGLRVVDVADTVAPIDEAHFDTSGEAVSVANDGQTLYLATLSAQHWSMQCDTCPPTICIDSWPAIHQNRLYVVKKPARDRFLWEIISGTGSTNLHRTLNKREVTNLWSDMTKLVATTPLLEVIESYDPPVGAVAHYRVFGAGSCDGASHWP